MDYMTIKQVCDEIGVSRHTVYRWVETRTLPAMNLAAGEERAMWRIARRDLEKFLATKRTQNIDW